MQAISSQPVTAKLNLLPALVCSCVCALLFSPSDAWAKPKRPDSKSEKSFWSRIAFSDDSPDFVPPPPQEERAEDEIEQSGANDRLNPQSAETLFEDEDEAIGPTIVDDQSGLAEEAQDLGNGDLDPLPPQREYFDPGVNSPYSSSTWQVMPSGLMYRSYLAGEKEPRIANAWLKDKSGRSVMESTLGGRIGLLRYGTTGAYRPQGWQFDLEGAAMTRVLPGTPSTELEAVDYRVGLLSTWAAGPWHVKAGYYHLSSHLGDEFIIANPLYPRLNYVRDSAITGVTYDLTDNTQIYGEIAYAFGAEDGAKPIEFQYGMQYSPLVFGLRGAPFAAMNAHVREDFDYAASINVQAGWQWRGSESQHLLRAGFQYYRGPALQYSFAGTTNTLIGSGIWVDF